MIWLPSILLCGSLLWICWEDLRDLSIPVTALILFALSGSLHQWMTPHPEWLICAAFLLGIALSAQGFFYGILGQQGLGSADVILFSLSGLWITLEDIPPFLIISGCFALILGILWHFLFQKHRFPMAPAILMGLVVILVIYHP